MPDISMCLNKKCKDSIRCYRFTAIAGAYQSYSDFKPVNGGCEHFIDSKEYSR